MWACARVMVTILVLTGSAAAGVDRETLQRELWTARNAAHDGRCKLALATAAHIAELDAEFHSRAVLTDEAIQACAAGPKQSSLAGQLIFGMSFGTAGAFGATAASLVWRSETASLVTYGISASLFSSLFVHIVDRDRVAESSLPATLLGAAAGSAGAIALYSYAGDAIDDGGIIIAGIVFPTLGAIIGSRLTRRFKDDVRIAVHATDDETVVGLGGRF